LIFDLLNQKSLVTTDITDGRKVSLGICKKEIENLDIAEAAKDGTIVDDKYKSKQSRLQDFFSNKQEADFVRRKKTKADASQMEEIDESSEEEKRKSPVDKPMTLSERKREVSQERISSMSAENSS
jgi:hypothetical protein